MANPPPILTNTSNSYFSFWNDDDTWYNVDSTVFGNKLKAPSASNVPKVASVANVSLLNKDTRETIEKKDQGGVLLR